jgi:hypothetical protein
MAAQGSARQMRRIEEVQKRLPLIVAEKASSDTLSGLGA